MQAVPATLLAVSLLAVALPRLTPAATAAAASVQETQPIAITRNGSRPSQRGPAANFTGAARINPLFDGTDSSRAGGTVVLGAAPISKRLLRAPRPHDVPPGADVNANEAAMKLRLTIDGKAVTATMLDNETTRDFVALLPLTLTLEDYAATEKISDLPRRLSTAGAPPGSDPSIGDITYYAPWGNLAVFYRDFGYSSGLVKLGTLDAGADALSQPGPLSVTIELIEEQQS